jgi:molecular chaperone HscB
MTAPVFDPTQDFFQLLGIPARFQIEAALLDEHYRALQSQVHPDKFAHLTEAEQRLAMQWATRVNEAYQTLRSPLNRGRYLLKLRGVDTQEETNTSMPVDFLMEQMERREAVEEATRRSDTDALDALQRRLQSDTRSLQQQLALQLDDENHYNSAAAAGTVRKLRFMEKLAEEIAAAFDEIDN